MDFSSIKNSAQGAFNSAKDKVKGGGDSGGADAKDDKDAGEGGDGKGADGGDGKAQETKPMVKDDGDALSAQDLPVYTEQQFEKRLRKKVEDRKYTFGKGFHGDDHRFSAYPRRWHVKMWDIRYRNMTKDEMSVFANFIFGGDMEEFYVEEHTSRGLRRKRIWVMGEEGVVIRTPVVKNVMPFSEPGRGNKDVGIQEVDMNKDPSIFEWCGSYADLDTMKLRIELWNWQKYRVNKLDCSFEQPLRDYASGSVYCDHDLLSCDRRNRNEVRGRIQFQLSIQEIYDFELSFLDWKAAEIPVLQKLIGDPKKDKRKITKSAPPNRMMNNTVCAESMIMTDFSNPNGGAGDGAQSASYTDEEEVEEDDTANEKNAKRMCCGLGPKIVSGGMARTTYKHLLIQAIGNSKALGLANNIRFKSKNIRCTSECSWETLGNFFFRGTISDLESMTLIVTLMSKENVPVDSAFLAGHEHEVNPRSKKTKRMRLPVGKTIISLRGILDYGYCRGDFGATPDITREIVRLRENSGQSQNAADINRMTYGRVEGKVTIDAQPKHRQKGDDMDLEMDKTYLLIKVVKVDHVAVPEHRRLIQLDTFVEVTYDGISQTSRTSRDSSSPIFNDTLAFEMRMMHSDDRTLLAQEIESKGPVQFDLWCQGEVGNDHLGGVEFYIHEILFLDDDRLNKKVVKTHYDRKKGEDEEYQTRVWNGKKQFSFVWESTDKESALYFEAWLKPDLGEEINIRAIPPEDYLPPGLRTMFPRFQQDWETVTRPLEKKGRSFPFKAMDQRRREHFLPLFLATMKPPKMIDSAGKISHLISNIPYEDKRTNVPMWFSPDFFIMVKKGASIEHALLHVSLLQGMPERAFVCLGSSWAREPHAWVCIFELEEEQKVLNDMKRHSSLFQQDGSHRLKHKMSKLGNASKIGNVSKIGGLFGKKKAPDPKGRKGRESLKPQGLALRSGSMMLGRIAEEKSEDTSGKPKVLVRFYEPSMGQTFMLPPDRLGDGERARLVHSNEIPVGKTLNDDEVEGELIRRKEGLLRAQRREGVGPMTLYNESLHAHKLKFACRDSALSEDEFCSVCGCSTGEPDDDVQTGLQAFRDQKYICETCGFEACWLCAVDHFNQSELDAIDVDVTRPVKFDDVVPLPYRTVEVVFNQTNCWANLQHESPVEIYWDFWNPMYWHQFAKCYHVSLNSFFRTKAMAPPANETWLNEKKGRLIEALYKSIRLHRNTKTLGTFFIRDNCLIEFLEKGLQLHEQYDLDANSYNEKRLNEWRTILEQKTPVNHQLHGMPLHFNFCDAEAITKHVRERCDFLDCREKTAQFCVSCYMRAWPNGVVSIYVYICLLHNLNEMRQKEMRMRREGRARHDALESDRGVCHLTRELFEELRNVQDEMTQMAVVEHDKLQRDLASKKRSQRKKAEKEMKKKQTALMETMEGQPLQFERRLVSSYIELDEIGCTAKYIAETGDELFGGLITNRALTVDLEKGVYFEVKIDAVKEAEDGLAIGVTGLSPADIIEMTPTIDELDPCWVVGFDGQMYDTVSMEWTEVSWKPNDLEEGDVLGFLVLPGGRSFVIVNGKIACEGPSDVQIDGRSKLYGVLDLIGNTVQVTLNPDAILPDLPDLPADKRSPAFGKHSSCIDLTQCGRSATLSSKERDQAVFSNGPILRYGQHEDGHFYELLIEEMIEDEDGDHLHNSSLLVGVTTLMPSEIYGIPEDIENIGPLWAARLDGKCYNGERKEWSQVDVDCDPLGSGDRVFVHVTPAGDLEVLVNGKVIITEDLDIPVSQKLVAVVVLEGGVHAVTMLSTPKAPGQVDSENASHDGSEPLVHTQEPMNGFCSPLLVGNSGHVNVTEMVQAECLICDDPEKDHCGFLGNGQIPRWSPEGRYFEVRIDRVRNPPDLDDGLSIGVTTRTKGTMTPTVDLWDPSWVVGFDGQSWDGQLSTWEDVPWQPSKLKVGDRVGCLVTPDGQMKIFQNGKLAAIGPEVPQEGEGELIAIFDLIGNTEAISYVDAPPPPGALEATLVNDSFPCSESNTPRSNNPPKMLPNIAVKPLAGGFYSENVGRFIQLSADGFEATYTRPNSDDLCGSILGKDPLPLVPGGGRYFAVAITRVNTGCYDGLAVGVTTQNPAEATVPLPATLDELEEPSWLIGYDGRLWDSNSFLEIEGWNPADLVPGDVVGIYIGPDGELVGFVNDEEIARFEDLDIPDVVYPALDLIGNTAGVKYVAGAMPPFASNQPDKMDMAEHSLESRTVSVSTFEGSMLSQADKLNSFYRAVSEFVQLSEDFRVATHEGTCQEEMYGGVLGDGPIPEFGAGKYFEVQIEETRPTQIPEGLAIGVTTSPLNAVREIPPAVDGLDNVWVAGFDGSQYSSPDGWEPIGWHPHELKRGDRVGVLVNQFGEMSIVINSSRVIAGPTGIPYDVDHFAVIDLIGNCKSIRLLPHAAPPHIAEMGAPRAILVKDEPRGPNKVGNVSGSPMPSPIPQPRGQDALSENGAPGRWLPICPEFLEISVDGLTVSHTGETGEEMYGGSLSSLPIDRCSEGRYFEVQVEATRADKYDGLAIGVTGCPPEQIEPDADIETIDLLDPAWTMGYDSQFWSFDAQAWSKVEFRPRELRRGDRVGILVADDGTLSVCVNDKRTRISRINVSPATPLWAVVDLIGCTRSVSLIPGAAPGNSVGQHQHGDFAYEVQTESTHADEADNNSSTNTDSDNANATRNGSKGTRDRLQSDVRSPLQGWATGLPGSLVDISAGGQVATHRDPDGVDMFGMVIGNGPLYPGPQGLYFEVQMEAMRTGDWPDGLTIGVTNLRAKDVAEVPDTIDLLDTVWAVGYDGQLWNGGLEEFIQLDWRTCDLQVGDHVGILVPPNGHLHVYKNGALQCVCQTDIFDIVPKDTQLYPVLDILGSSLSVRLVVGATAPGRSALAELGRAANAILPPVQSIMNGFNRSLAGKSVKVFDDGQTAEYLDAGRAGNGGLVGDAPLKEFPEGRYFEIELVNLGPKKQPDGFRIGVAAQRPTKTVNRLHNLDATWLTNIEGKFWNYRAKAWSNSGWVAHDLEDGDHIGVLVTTSGTMSINVNGRPCWSAPCGIPDIDLFAILELGGPVKMISYIVDADPPPMDFHEGERTLSDSLTSGAHTSDQGVVGPNVQYGLRSDTMTGFRRELVSKYVRLSSDGLSAERKGGPGDMYGGIITDGPIPFFKEGFYFEVRVDDCCQGPDDGLVLGVTTRPPRSIIAMPETVDLIDPCWSAGYDGHTYDGGADEWITCNWKPVNLNPGDRVGLLVTPEGEMHLFENGRSKVEAPFMVQLEGLELFGLVDLLGTTRAVTLRKEADPPARALKVRSNIGSIEYGHCLTLPSMYWEGDSDVDVQQ